MSVVDDQRGSPTFAADLARLLLDLAHAPASGVFHVTNGGSTTWHGFAARIFREAGISVRERAICETNVHPSELSAHIVKWPRED